MGVSESLNGLSFLKYCSTFFPNPFDYEFIRRNVSSFNKLGLSYLMKAVVKAPSNLDCTNNHFTKITFQLTFYMLNAFFKIGSAFGYLVFTKRSHILNQTCSFLLQVLFKYVWHFSGPGTKRRKVSASSYSSQAVIKYSIWRKNWG